MHMVSVLSASLHAPGWPGIFSLRVVVISSNDLMIINSGLFFDLTLGYYLPGCVSVLLLLQVPKRKEREEKKEDS
jgi:hypothetical protein